MNEQAGPLPSVLRQKPFVLYWFARICTAMAFQMTSVAIGWQIYAMTGSAFDLGLVGLVQYLPMVVLNFVVGQVADSYERRTVASICQFIEAGSALLLAVGTYQGWLSREAIFIIVAVFGAARAFESPTMSALLPGLVPAADLQRALTLASSAQQVASIVGPALGGFLYAIGPLAVYATAALLFLCASSFSALIPAGRMGKRLTIVTLKTVFSGIAFIIANPIILGAISLDLFAVLLGGAVALLPIYARDILHTGPEGLGLLRAAPSVGALGMSLALAYYPLNHKVGVKLFASVIVFGLMTVIFGISTNFFVSMAALMLLGASDLMSVVIRAAIVQMGTPDEMRGRVSAVDSLFTGTSNQLGQFESGVTAAWFGTVPAVLIGGVGTVLVAFLWMKLFPSLRRANTIAG